MRELAIDIETYSPEDIRKCGAYRYASHPDFKVLLFAYAFDHEEPRVVDLACGESLPPEVLRSLRDPDVLKTAWNAAFERICLSRMLGLPVGQYLPPDQWDCSMVAAAHTGFPLSLEDAGKALDLSADEAKLKEGKTLIRYFCRPAKNGKPHQPDEAPDKWATFKEYCRRDVRAEQVIRSKVTRLQQPEWERKLWLTDQAINDRGVMLDTVLAKAAVAIEAERMPRWARTGTPPVLRCRSHRALGRSAGASAELATKPPPRHRPRPQSGPSGRSRRVGSQLRQPAAGAQ